MPTSEEKQRLLARLIAENRVTFALDSTQDDWPESHVGIFSRVHDLGNVKFEQYREEAQRQPERTPWKAQRLSEALNLVQLTSRCIRERLNEAGWRSQLEHHLFGAFTYGVSCKTCGGRLLRALQDPPEDSFEPLRQDLELRRENRQECHCLRNGSSQQPERSLNELFSSRAGEYIIRDPTTDELLPRQGPDRVYGLRRTSELETILSSKYPLPESEEPNDKNTLSDIIQTTPFLENDEPLLLPFLVAEFKSEKAAVGFHDIQHQTALPIRRLLQLQMGLRSAAPSKASAVLNPLVWFFAFRGDDVRVYGACITDEGLGQRFQVACLLDCRISKRDGALQLLLLVDFLLEWARDIYLPTVKHQMKILLADDDSLTFHGGTDATTLRQYRKKRPFDPDPAVDSEAGDVSTTLDLFPEGLDTPIGIVRSAYNIESRFRGLLLREQEAEALFRALGNAGVDVRKLADKIVRLFRASNSRADDRCLITERSLNELEEIWTGNIRQATGKKSRAFWSKIQFSTYLSHDWEQVRELSYIAVSEEALEVIQSWSDVKKNHVQAPSEIASGLLERMLIKLKEGSIEHNLIAAISRSTLSIPQAILANDADGYRNDMGSIWDQDVSLERLGDGFSYEIVLSIFGHLEHHQKEHGEYGLRESQKSEMQQQTRATGPWPIRLPRLVHCDKGMVLVHGEYSAKTRAVRELRGHQKPDLCVFVLEKIPNFVERLGIALKDTVLTWSIYHTVRRDRSNLSAQWGDRNDGLDFLHIGHWPYRREPKSEVVFQAMLKWMELLNVAAGDDLPRPQESFDAGGWICTPTNNDWKKRMLECAEVHRKLHGFEIKERDSSPGIAFATRQMVPSQRLQLLPPEVETQTTQGGFTSPAASDSKSFATDEYIIETVDLTQDSE